MSIPPAFDLNEWDLRHFSLPTAESKQNAFGWRAEGPKCIESLWETIENAYAAAADGWQLARVKVEEDEAGRNQLDVWLKRQKTDVPQVPLNVPTSNRAA
jgi:hypothetical protein